MFAFQNGIKIDTNARLEYTEDMYPTGLLLAVTKATETAEYTCKVTNEAGAASATAYLFVVPSMIYFMICFVTVKMV